MFYRDLTGQLYEQITKDVGKHNVKYFTKNNL